MSSFGGNEANLEKLFGKLDMVHYLCLNAKMVVKKFFAENVFVHTINEDTFQARNLYSEINLN